MTIRRGRRHEATIDGKTVWLDSLNEAVALSRFVDQYKFSGKWDRPAYGIKHAGKYYTPDFELAVNDYGNTARALVEVKQYRRDFTKDMAVRMCAVAGHYRTDCLFLYTVKTDAWYRVIPRSGIVRSCTPPQSGVMMLSELVQPARYVTQNYHGRHYYQSFMDGLFSILHEAFFSKNPKRHRGRARR